MADHIEKLSVVLIGDVNSGKTTVFENFKALIDRHNSVNIDQKLQQVKSTTKLETYKDISITRRFHLTFIDTPGDKSYAENMITGLCQANCAVLVVSAKEEEFEEAMKESIENHIMWARTMGIRSFICLVNKMDATHNFSMERFDLIKRGVSKKLKMHGISPETTPFIPVSGLKGDNIVYDSYHMPWFQGWKTSRLSGKTFIDAINSTQLPMPDLDKPFRMVINEVRNQDGTNYISGLIQSGRFKIGSNFNKSNKAADYQETEFTISPGNIKAKLGSIDNNPLKRQVYAGEYVHFSVTGQSLERIKRGMVVGLSTNQPPKEAETFDAKIVIVNDFDEIKLGSKPKVHCHSSHMPCELVKIEKINARTHKPVEDSTSFKPVCGAKIVLKPTEPMCVETFDCHKKLGSVVIKDQNQVVVAVGRINSIKHKEPSV